MVADGKGAAICLRAKRIVLSRTNSFMEDIDVIPMGYGDFEGVCTNANRGEGFAKMRKDSADISEGAFAVDNPQ
jgi:hypothetical protein